LLEHISINSSEKDAHMGFLACMDNCEEICMKGF
jgi:hypothetical protein